MILLIFDIDGTLTDTKDVDDHCFIATFEEEYNLKLQNIDWADFKNVTDLGLFKELFSKNFNKKPAKKDIKSFQKRFFLNLKMQLDQNPDKFKAVTGASEFIQLCIECNNINIAFATGGLSFSAKMKLNAGQIPFENIPFSSSDTLISRKGILNKAIQLSKKQYQRTHFEKIWYFGDGVWDFKTTQALNIPFIGVDIKKDNKLKSLGAENVITNFEDKEVIYRNLKWV